MVCLALSFATTNAATKMASASCSQVTVADSYFYSISSSTSGGALLINTSVYVNISGSLFTNCTSTGTNTNGGAISLMNTYAVGVQKSCAYSCWSTLEGMSFYAYPSSYAAVTYSYISFCKCPDNNQGYWTGLEANYASVIADHLNASSNVPSSRIASFGSFGDTSFFAQFCTFSNCIGDTMTEVSDGSGTRNLSKIVYYNNTIHSTSGTNAVIYVRVSLYAKELTFIKQSYLMNFLSDGTYGTVVTAESCIFDSSSYSHIGSVVFLNSIITASTQTSYYSCILVDQCLKSHYFTNNANKLAMLKAFSIAFFEIVLE